MTAEARRAAVVTAARLWIGTPYVHAQATLGVAVDCVGLVNGVGIETGFMDFDRDRWAQFEGYGPRPNVRVMRRYMETFHIPSDVGARDLPLIGTIGWFAWRAGLPMHLGILAEQRGRLTMIHANNITGKCCEHTFDAEWHSRVDSWWNFRMIGI